MQKSWKKEIYIFLLKFGYFTQKRLKGLALEHHSRINVLTPVDTRHRFNVDTTSYSTSIRRLYDVADVV